MTRPRFWASWASWIARPTRELPTLPKGPRGAGRPATFYTLDTGMAAA